MGIIKDDRQNGLMEVGVPMGVVALIPSTNPTHPQRCTSRLFQSKRAMPLSSVRIRMPRIVLLRLQRSFVKQPEKPVRQRVLQCITLPTMEATDALLKNRNIGIILATGGEAMVRVQLTVQVIGPWLGRATGPALLKSHPNIPVAVKRIMDSKTFDNGTIWHQKQSIITERCSIEQRRWWMKSAVRAVTL